MYDLDGRVAFVTGASSGLGWRFAQTLARAGARVVAAARRREKLDGLVAEIREAGGQAHAITLDIKDTVAIAGAIDEAETVFGTVDILVNNAADPDPALAVQLSPERIDSLIDTNLKAPFVLSTEVARRLMAADKPGRIVNISSIGAYHYTPNTSAALYCITKSAISRMTEVLAMEWASTNINVNGIAPGLFQTAMSEIHFERLGGEAVVAQVLEQMPRKRIGRPEQLDSTLLYLVSPASECVTGVTIVVDDGQSAR